MRIKELARATGVDVETIRYYEKAGLVPAPARHANGYRNYQRFHLQRLAFIRHCRALEMPLADIQRLLQVLDAPAQAQLDIETLVDEQLLRVRARLAGMHALEMQLLLLRDSCTGRHGDAGCGILHELVSAAHGASCACHGAKMA